MVILGGLSLHLDPKVSVIIAGLLRKRNEAKQLVVKLEEELEDIKKDARSLLDISEKAIKDNKVMKQLIVRMEFDVVEYELELKAMRKGMGLLAVVCIVVVWLVILLV